MSANFCRQVVCSLVVASTLSDSVSFGEFMGFSILNKKDRRMGVFANGWLISELVEMADSHPRITFS